MSPEVMAAIVVASSLGAWAFFMAYLRARPEAAPQVESSLIPSEASGGVAVAERAPKPRRPADEAAGVTRRQFLNRAYFAAVLVALGNFALASLDYPWPGGGRRPAAT